MKKSILAFILPFLIFFSCGSKPEKKKISYKYKIEGKVKTVTSKNNLPFNSGIYQKDTIYVDAIAYTDTIHGHNQDSIWYYNSDGSKLTVLSPYSVTKF